MKETSPPSIETYDLRLMRTFPVPTVWFSHLVKRSPTEMRLGLFVTRQTIGWGISKIPIRRKARALITHNQLQRYAGCRSAAAISKAIDSLVRAGLIEVLSEGGKVLLTPQERRCYHKPLWFRIPQKYVEERPTPVDKLVDKARPVFKKQQGMWRFTAPAESEDI